MKFRRVLPEKLRVYGKSVNNVLYLNEGVCLLNFDHSIQDELFILEKERKVLDCEDGEILPILQYKKR